MPAPFSHGASLTMHGQQMAWDQLLALTTTAGNVAVKNGEKITMALQNMSMILLTKALLKVDPLLALQTTSHPLLGQRMGLGIPVGGQQIFQNKITRFGGFFYLAK